MVMEFYGVEHRIYGRRDTGHDEDGLVDDRIKGKACQTGQVDQDESADRAHDQTDCAAHPGVRIGKGEMGPVNLHAQGNHDDSHQGLGTALEDRPHEEGSHIYDACKFNGKHGHQRIDDRHVKDNGNGVPGSQFSYTGLVESQCVEAHIHLDQHNGGTGTGFRKVWKLSIDYIGSIGKDEGNEGDTDIPIIGEHGPVFRADVFPASIPRNLPYKVAMAPMVNIWIKARMNTFSMVISSFAT